MQLEIQLLVISFLKVLNLEVEVWSYAEEAYTFQELLQSPIPVDIFWKKEENAVALKVFFKSLIERFILIQFSS